MTFAVCWCELGGEKTRPFSSKQTGCGSTTSRYYRSQLRGAATGAREAHKTVRSPLPLSSSSVTRPCIHRRPNEQSALQQLSKSKQTDFWCCAAPLQRSWLAPNGGIYVLRLRASSMDVTCDRAGNKDEMASAMQKDQSEGRYIGTNRNRNRYHCSHRGRRI